MSSVHSLEDFWVDPDRCLSHFLCVDLAPVFFQMREEGMWAVGVRPADVTAMAEVDVAAVLWAAAHCPVAAIKVRLAGGELVDAHSAMLRSLAHRPGQG